MLRLKIILAALFFLAPFCFAQNVSSGAAAAEDQLSAVLNEMEAADRGINTLELNFTQVTTFLETGEKQNSQGYMAFMKPSAIFIDIKKPQEQKIYIDGNKMTVWTIKTKQAVITNTDDNFMRDFSPTTFINFGGNWTKLKKTHNIRLDSQTASVYILSLWPKKQRTWTVKIQISKQTLNPIKLTLTTKATTVDIVLSDYKLNQTLDKQMFRLPQNIETIKLN
ncbi:MAG: outer-membrane lipoprotein carrier protein LolA [Elusimicrobiota bacterium]|jgi:outer membrane lipoprotein-sorting protein|nr:outer-membrane lipoprotein carrier protein LolA [Elusimicrobiota bacterium]